MSKLQPLSVGRAFQRGPYIINHQGEFIYKGENPEEFEKLTKEFEKLNPKVSSLKIPLNLQGSSLNAIKKLINERPTSLVGEFFEEYNPPIVYDKEGVNLQKASHTVLDVFETDEGVFGKIRIINSPSGRSLREKLSEGKVMLVARVLTFENEVKPITIDAVVK